MSTDSLHLLCFPVCLISGTAGTTCLLYHNKLLSENGKLLTYLDIRHLFAIDLHYIRLQLNAFWIKIIGLNKLLMAFFDDIAHIDNH